MIVEAFKNRPVNIGRLGENEARIISFPVGDMQSEFPGCSFLVLNRRKGDPSAYPVPAANCTVEYNHLYWTVMSGDVAKEGSGECQIVAILNNKVMKSDIYMTVTGRALDGAGTPPDPWVGWATYVAQRVLDAEAYAIGTREGVPVDEEDQTYHNNSKYWAEYTVGMLNTKADKADTVLATTLSRGRSGTAGNASIAFGSSVKATANFTEAFGSQVEASALYALAAGYLSKATGNASAAIGHSVEANANYAVAFGYRTRATIPGALAFGLCNRITGRTETFAEFRTNHTYRRGDRVFQKTYNSSSGKYEYDWYVCLRNHTSGSYLNIVNFIRVGISESVSSTLTTFTYAPFIEMVGSGNVGGENNARALDIDGNEYINGNIYVGCSPDSSGGTKVATVTEVAAKLDASMKGSANGVAELDGSGKVPSSQLPSYVDDILEYDSVSDFPPVGESGKIYVALDTNMTYRWGRIEYVQIKGDLALGETSQTAYRGDRGKAAYDHAVAKGSAFASGFYKITTNSEGHVTEVTAVEKSDITALGVRGEDVATVEDTEAMMEEYEEEVVA